MRPIALIPLAFAAGALGHVAAARLAPAPAVAEPAPVAAEVAPVVTPEPAAVEPSKRDVKLARLAELGIDCADFYNPANLPSADTNGNGALDMADEIELCVVPE